MRRSDNPGWGRQHEDPERVSTTPSRSLTSRHRRPTCTTGRRDNQNGQYSGGLHPQAYKRSGGGAMLVDVDIAEFGGRTAVPLIVICQYAVVRRVAAP